MDEAVASLYIRLDNLGEKIVSSIGGSELGPGALVVAQSAARPARDHLEGSFALQIVHTEDSLGDVKEKDRVEFFLRNLSEQIGNIVEACVWCGKEGVVRRECRIRQEITELIETITIADEIHNEIAPW
mmetsp:Transcript_33949/g.79931  ORF Transcript_33949/g.79931 Transcript_33949/m.79931 type:complete len:129 (-) Transcript_33949:1392-1778(-)